MNPFPRLLAANVLLLAAPLLAQTIPDSIAPTTMAPVRVSAGRVAASEVDGPQIVDRFDTNHIATTGAFSIGEFLDTLPPGEEGSRELVLVDGRPTFLDPASLPLGLIASIEVSRAGSMPHLGAFTNGRIINITLKKEGSAHEAGAKLLGAFAGGGSQRTVRASSVSTHGAFRSVISWELQRTAALSAADREYSRNQDRRARGGQDFRLGWGSPAVVQFSRDALPDFPDGIALVRDGAEPRGQIGPPAGLANFIPGDAALSGSARNQRRFDSSPYRTLIAPARRGSLNAQVTYTPSDRLQLTFSGSHVSSRSERLGPPPVTPAGEDTRVPAALNPFGEDVRIGLVHVEFGPTRQRTRAQRSQLGLGASMKLGREWAAEASLGYRRTVRDRRTRDLDLKRFAAALTAENPAERFDPFADATARPVNAALYPLLSGERSSRQGGRRTEVELTARGPVTRTRAGPVTLRLDTEHTLEAEDRVSNPRTNEPLVRTSASRQEHEASAVLQVPFFSERNARAGLRRLDTQVSGQYGFDNDGGRETETGLGLVWAPLRALSLRVRYSSESEAPSRTFAAATDLLLDDMLLDPRRDREPTLHVQSVLHGDTLTTPERDRRLTVGLTFEPRVFPSLTLSAALKIRDREHVFEDEPSAQEVVNNERTLSGRVVRATPTDEDRARGWPGAIVAVDLTPGSTGAMSRRDVDLKAEYRPPPFFFGQLLFRVTAERNLSFRRDVLPGVGFVHEIGADTQPRRWNGDGLVEWSRKAWSLSTRVRHTGSVRNVGPTPPSGATTVLDLNCTWRWNSVRRAAGEGKREWRITAGIGNAFDAPPPWADNLSGFASGSPLGRTYSLAMNLTF